MINLQNNTYDISAGARAVRHNVLRNTYWLLALSMVPTVLGAVVGLMAGMPSPRGAVGMLLFLGIAWASSGALSATRIPAWAWPCCWASPSSWA